MINTDMISDWLKAMEDVARAEKVVKRLKKAARDREEEILGMLAQSNARKVNVDGVTVSPRRDMYASAVAGAMPQLIDGLKAAGFGGLCAETVNAQRLRGFVNEFDPERILSAQELRDKLPEEIRDHVNLYEKHALGISRSK